MLLDSDRLNEADLVANAKSKSQQHLAAIAQRKTLSEAVTDVLVTRGDHRVAHTVVRNKGARFSDAAFRLLVKRSAGDDTLALRHRRTARSAAPAFSAICSSRPRPRCGHVLRPRTPASSSKAC